MENKNYELFLKSDVSEYIGEWVAICDKKIVAHGKNVKEVVKEASQKCYGKRPLIARIPEKETMIF
ncbi:hypothetical protein A3K73_03820 [Candidatus Pacearchaeota archaeon RBG_13_36_9]|nr:MAG: hypothetical protein A3K73_03820 [Candidatus Pacearchaeota archaeon RBG_13_36_9]